MSKRMTKARQHEALIHGAWKCYQHSYYAASYRLHKRIKEARRAGNHAGVAALDKAFDERYPAPPGHFAWFCAGEIWTQNAGTVVRFRFDDGELICSFELRDGRFRRIH